MTAPTFLTVKDHSRNVGGMKYIYPVVSRRAGGVSIGINLNTNNACNWRCIYCEVPNLTRGSSLPIELDVLAQELRVFLADVLHGDFMLRNVAEADRHLKDIAFSGNGEPTSAKEFPQVVLLVEKVLREFGLLDKHLPKPINVRLITNGSLVDKPAILSSLRHLARCNGEVWFKLDAGTVEGIARINDVNLNPNSHLRRLQACAEVCPTFIQTCMFAFDGKPPSEADISAYLKLVNQVASKVQGVHLYGIARPSLQAESKRLSQLSAEQLEAIAERIRLLGLAVYVSP